MEEEVPLSEVQSLRIIHEMIDATKSSFLQDGYLYLFWGWTILACSIGEYLLMLFQFSHPYITWAIMPLAGLKYALYLRKRKSTMRVKSHIDEFMAYLWISFVIAILVILSAFKVLGYHNVLPLIIILYGIGTLASGGALRFRQLIIAGLMNYPLAILGFFISFENQLLILSLAVTFSYIIPGYLLKANYNSKHV